MGLYTNWKEVSWRLSGSGAVALRLSQGTEVFKASQVTLE